MSFISRIFWWKRISELEKLVEKQHEIIKELGERSKETVLEGKKHEEIVEKFKNDIREISSTLEKEKERTSSLEREISKEQRINNELKGKLKEVNNKYQEVIEKFEKEKQTAITLEMLILDLNKELRLMDIAKKIEVEEKTPEITIKKFSR